jgi:hypothetical protein
MRQTCDWFDQSKCSRTAVLFLIGNDGKKRGYCVRHHDELVKNIFARWHGTSEEEGRNTLAWARLAKEAIDRNHWK